MHSNIVKALKGPPAQQHDNELQHNINAWTTNLNDEHKITLTKSIFSAALFVAEYLKQQKAVLLPWICQVFQSTHCATSSSDLASTLVLEVGDSNVNFSARWLLNQLILYFYQHMAYKCIHKKFGTVLYRKGGHTDQSLMGSL